MVKIYVFIADIIETRNNKSIKYNLILCHNFIRFLLYSCAIFKFWMSLYIK